MERYWDPTRPRFYRSTSRRLLSCLSYKFPRFGPDRYLIPTRRVDRINYDLSMGMNEMLKVRDEPRIVPRKSGL